MLQRNQIKPYNSYTILMQNDLEVINVNGQFIKLIDFSDDTYKQLAFTPLNNNNPNYNHDRYYARISDTELFIKAISKKGISTSEVMLFRYDKEFLDQYYGLPSEMSNIHPDLIYAANQREVQRVANKTFFLKTGLSFLNLFISAYSGFYLCKERSFDVTKSFICSAVLFSSGCYLTSSIKIHPQSDLMLILQKQEYALRNF